MNLPRGSPRQGERSIDHAATVIACAQRLGVSISCCGQTNNPVPLPIVEVEQEAEGIVTLWVDVPLQLAHSFCPGQYYMCWNPYDAAGGMQQAHLHSEKPYSVGDIRFSAGDAYLEPDTGGAETAQMGFTVKDLGRQSGQLIQMQVGDWLAIRGPYGNSFPNPQADSRLVLVSGGIGSTPMYMAAWDARRRLGDRILIEAVLGFRNQAESHFIERMQRVCDRVEITTDDGSLGQQGFPTSALVQILSDTTSAGSDPSTRVYTCGPEVMMAGVLSMAQEYGIEAWAAMERYLPCSMAVCGLCMIGDRLTCRDGPVMEGEWLLQQADFGAEQAHMH